MADPKILENLSPDDQVIIWSNEHRAWWKPDKEGYTLLAEDPSSYLSSAGIYDRAEAERIVTEAYIGWTEGNQAPEVIVPLSSRIHMFELAGLAGEMTRTAILAWEARDRRAQLEQADKFRLAVRVIDPAVIATLDPAVWVSHQAFQRAERALTSFGLEVPEVIKTILKALAELLEQSTAATERPY